MQFLQSLKSKSVKSGITRLVLSIVGLIGATVVLWMFFGADKYFRGPVDLATLPQDQWEGEYVYYDVELVLDYYAYSAKSGSDNYSSIEYMALTPDWEQWMGIWLVKGDVDKYEPQFWDMLDGYIEGYYNDDNPVSLRLTGTIESMDSASKKLFNEAMDYYGYSRDDATYYILMTNRIDDNSPWLYFIVWGIMGLLVLWAVYVLIRSVTGGGQKAVVKYAESTGDKEGTLARLDTWFAEATPVEKKLYMGPELFVNQNGAKTKIYNMADVVWAYQYSQTNRGVTSYFLTLGLLNGKKPTIGLSENGVQEALRYINKNLGWIAVGYTDELKRLFKQSPETLRTTAQQQRAGQAALTPEDEAIIEELEAAYQASKTTPAE